MWLAHCFATGEWFSLDALAMRLYPDAPSPEAALVWAARDAGRLANIMQSIAANALQAFEELIARYTQGMPQTHPHQDQGTAHNRSFLPPTEDRLWAWPGVVRRVLQAVCEEWISHGASGQVAAGASVRWLAQRLGLPYEEVSDALNWLVAVGFLAKCGRDVRPGQRGSPPERFAVCLVDPETAWKRWASFGFAPPRQVTGKWLARFWPAEEVAKVIRGYRVAPAGTQSAEMRILVRSTKRKPASPLNLAQCKGGTGRSVTKILVLSTKPNPATMGKVRGNDGQEEGRTEKENRRTGPPG